MLTAAECNAVLLLPRTPATDNKIGKNSIISLHDSRPLQISFKHWTENRIQLLLQIVEWQSVLSDKSIMYTAYIVVQEMYTAQCKQQYTDRMTTLNMC